MEKKTSCRGICFISCMFNTAGPQVWYVDLESDGDIIGKRCRKLKYDSKITRDAYGIACAIVIVSSASAIIILYGKIGCFIFGHLRTHKFRKAFARLSRRRIPLSIKRNNALPGLRFDDRHIDVERKQSFDESGMYLSSNYYVYGYYTGIFIVLFASRNFVIVGRIFS